MNPTPLGEGKTTVSIGLADGLRKIGKKSVLALREPSLGPVFGVKGGACGGGYSQVIPMEDINLHFNGDFHAITYANNLLSSLIDNHIMQGNELKIDKVFWRRCIDLNDRALRNVTVAKGGGKNGVEREDGFNITAASEVMAILCLANSFADLKKRLGDILIGLDKDGKEIFARDLNAQDAMAILLKDAIFPNLVQTLEGTPAFVHGGPFANIAHGCNTVAATRLALSLSEYTVTEAGFGAELGAEKFFDIKCRYAKLNPSAVVLVVTLRSIKYNANVAKENTAEPDAESLKKGFCNVERHLKNLRDVFNQNVVVAINRFPTDTDDEVALLKSLCENLGSPCVVSNGFSKGGLGCVDLAKAVVTASESAKELTFSYPLDASVKDKILAVATKIYGASTVSYSPSAEKTIANLDEKYTKMPICIAKTQYSFSSDANQLGAPTDFNFEVKEVLIRAGAGFLVVQCGDILLMPGLSKIPQASKMAIDENTLEISGLM